MSAGFGNLMSRLQRQVEVLMTMLRSLRPGVRRLTHADAHTLRLQLEGAAAAQGSIVLVVVGSVQDQHLRLSASGGQVIAPELRGRFALSSASAHTTVQVIFRASIQGVQSSADAFSRICQTQSITWRPNTPAGYHAILILGGAAELYNAARSQLTEESVSTPDGGLTGIATTAVTVWLLRSAPAPLRWVRTVRNALPLNVRPPVMNIPLQTPQLLPYMQPLPQPISPLAPTALHRQQSMPNLQHPQSVRGVTSDYATPHNIHHTIDYLPTSVDAAQQTTIIEAPPPQLHGTCSPLSESSAGATTVSNRSTSSKLTLTMPAEPDLNFANPRKINRHDEPAESELSKPPPIYPIAMCDVPQCTTPPGEKSTFTPDAFTTGVTNIVSWTVQC